MDIKNVRCTIRPYWHVGGRESSPFLFETLICMVTGAKTQAQMRAETEFLNNAKLKEVFEQIMGMLLEFDAEECWIDPDNVLRQMRFVFYKHASTGQRMGFAFVVWYQEIMQSIDSFRWELKNCKQQFEHLERKLEAGEFDGQ